MENKALKKKPIYNLYLSNSYLGLGEAYVRLKKYDKANSYFDKVLSILSQYNSINYALCEQILNIEKPFDVFRENIIKYFLQYSGKIVNKIDERISKRNDKEVVCNYFNINTTYDYKKLKDKVIKFIQSIS